MNKFNYMPTSPWSNPAREIEKTTNEIPTENKARTTAKKATKPTTKTTAKKSRKTTAKKSKKVVESK